MLLHLTIRFAQPKMLKKIILSQVFLFFQTLRKNLQPLRLKQILPENTM